MRRNRLAMAEGELSCAAVVKVSRHKVGTDDGRWVVEDWRLEDGQSWQSWEVLRGEGKQITPPDARRPSRRIDTKQALS